MTINLPGGRRIPNFTVVVHKFYNYKVIGGAFAIHCDKMELLTTTTTTTTTTAKFQF